MGNAESTADNSGRASARRSASSAAAASDGADSFQPADEASASTWTQFKNSCAARAGARACAACTARPVAGAPERPSRHRGGARRELTPRASARARLRAPRGASFPPARYEEIIESIIRPPRAEYTDAQLGPRRCARLARTRARRGAR